MEPSVEYSEQQAALIKMAGSFLCQLDLDYLKNARRSFQETANKQETMIMFSPSYPPQRIEALRLRAKALQSIIDYVETLKLIDEKEQLATDHEANFGEILKLLS